MRVFGELQCRAGEAMFDIESCALDHKASLRAQRLHGLPWRAASDAL